MNSSLRWAWWEQREALWSYQVTWIMCPKTLLARFMLIYGGIVCSCLIIAMCQQWTWLHWICPTHLWISPSIFAEECWPWKCQVSETRHEVCTTPNTRQSLDVWCLPCKLEMALVCDIQYSDPQCFQPKMQFMEASAFRQQQWILQLQDDLINLRRKSSSHFVISFSNAKAGDEH